MVLFNKIPWKRNVLKPLSSLAFLICTYGAEHASAQAPAPITVSQTTTANAGGGWTTTTEVCNNTPAATDIIYWSWPRAKDGTGKIGTRSWQPPAAAPPTGPPAGSPPGTPAPPQELPQATAAGITVAAGKCAPKTTDVYPKEGKQPFSVYVRVFEKVGGQWVQRVMIAHDIHMTVAGCVFNLDPPTTFVAARIPIPFPAELADLTPGPLTFFIKNIKAPAGWKVSYVLPGIGKGFQLRSNQKNFEGIVVLEIRRNAFPSGNQVSRQIVETTWSVRPTPAIRKEVPYERTIRSVFLHDIQGPVLDLAVQQQSDAAASIVVRAYDPGGINELPVLTIAGPTSQDYRIMPISKETAVDAESAIGVTEAEYRIELPGQALKGKKITVRLHGQCGKGSEVVRELQ